MRLISERPFPWQTPVITERHAYECLRDHPLAADVTFLAGPWAPIIDHKNFGLPKNKKIATLFLENLRHRPLENSFTICQSYRFREITKFLRSGGVKVLFTPHAAKEEYFDGIKIEPLPLFAVNGVEPGTKDLRYSFVGAYADTYLSPIRADLFNDAHPEDTIVIQRKKWQFNDAVYGEQLRGLPTNNVQQYIAEQHLAFYKGVLARSRFSLCPSGMGPSSIRFFESLQAGAIPVVLADGWRIPTPKGVNWSQCILKIPESNYNKLRETLQSISPEQEHELRSNCIKAFKQVSGKNFVKCIRNYYG